MAETETLTIFAETRHWYVWRPSWDRDVETKTTTLQRASINKKLFGRGYRGGDCAPHIFGRQKILKHSFTLIWLFHDTARTKDSHPKRFFAQFRPTISALGYPKYGTPISVVGHPSLQSVQWLNKYVLPAGLHLWHYTQISLHRMVEKRQSKFSIREFLVSFAVSVLRELKTPTLWIWPPITSPKRYFVCVKRASEL